MRTLEGTQQALQPFHVGGREQRRRRGGGSSGLSGRAHVCDRCSRRRAFGPTGLAEHTHGEKVLVLARRAACVRTKVVIGALDAEHTHIRAVELGIDSIDHGLVREDHLERYDLTQRVHALVRAARTAPADLLQHAEVVVSDATRLVDGVLKRLLDGLDVWILLQPVEFGSIVRDEQHDFALSERIGPAVLILALPLFAGGGRVHRPRPRRTASRASSLHSQHSNTQFNLHFETHLALGSARQHVSVDVSGLGTR